MADVVGRLVQSELLRGSFDPGTCGSELAMQALEHDFGVDILTCTSCLVSGAKPACDELRLNTPPLDARVYRRFDEHRHGLALSQHRLQCS